MGICALCQSKAELRLSHIVSSFFGAYLKETSATGHLRSADTPNLRVQDLRKERLLCDACEERLSVWEGEYKEKAFKLLQDDNFRGLEYGAWLLPFLVSISWRVLAAEQKELITRRPKFRGVVERTLQNWRLFLLGERSQPQSEHHLFVFAGIPQSMPPDSHERSLDYVYRAVDATTAVGNRGIFVYTKALRSLIFSPIVPSTPSGWENTRVHAGQGRLVSPQKIAMRGFGAFFNSRIELAFGRPLSGKQLTKIEEAMVQNPDRALASESYKVRVASRKLIRPGESREGGPYR
jgi:hypothetical protein